MIRLDEQEAAHGDRARADSEQAPFQSPPQNIEDSLPAFFERLADPVLCLDRQGRILWANPAARRLFDPAELTHADLESLLSATSDSPLGRAWRRACDGHSEQAEHWDPQRQRWYEISLTPCGDCLCLMPRDVTRHHRAQQAAERERLRLRKLLDQAPVPITIKHGPEHRYTFVNRAFTELAGGRDVLNRPIREAFPELQDQNVFERLDEVYRSGTGYTGVELPVVAARTPGGTPEQRYVSAVIEPLRDEQGRIEGTMSLSFEVTDQVRARRHLEATLAQMAEMEERLRLALEAGDVGTWDHDLRHGTLAWNRRAREVLGLPEGVTPSHDLFLQCVHPEDRARVDHLVQCALEPTGSGEFGTQMRIIGPRESRERWVEARGRALFDEHGQAIRFLGTCIDITRQKRGESTNLSALRRETEARRQAEAASRKLEALHHMGQALTDTDLDVERTMQVLTDEATRLVGAQFGAFFRNTRIENDQAFALYTLSGAPKAAFAGLGLPSKTDVLSPTFSGDRIVRYDDVTQAKDYGRSRLHGGMPRGHLPVRSYLAVPVTARSGDILGALLFGHPEPDRFTEEHERLLKAVAPQAAVALENAKLYASVQAAEQRFRDLVNNVDGIVYERDASGAVRFVSRQAEAMLGHPVSEWLRDPAFWQRLLHPADRERVLAEWGDAVRQCANVDLEYRVITADGRTLWVRDLVRPSPEPDSSSRMLHGILLDISTLKAAEAEREQYLDELEHAVHSSEVLMGVLGHDLRNPLTAIGATAMLMQRGSDNPRVAQWGNRIQDSVHRMARLIDQILDFTRIRLGKGLPLARRPVDLAQLCRQTVEEVQSGFPDTPVHSNCGKGIVGHWDEDRLLQMLSNLLRNAVQHGEPGAPISLHIDHVDTEHVHLSVHNRGMIPEELLPVIFEPLRSSRDGKASGSRSIGLGLYISQQVVLAHGGRITVRSDRKDGTRFVVELPRDTDSPAR